MLKIGEIVDNKYTILHQIGRGGMSTVFLALNERANKQWAIKEIRREGVDNYGAVRRGLLVETEMLKRLSHPGLPTIVDVIDGADSFLIVMDYVEGKSLKNALAEYGALPQTNVIEWAKQLCDILEYLHTRKPPIIYRDMKPGNIILRPDGTIMLIDFGTARFYSEENREDTTYLGTRGYAAPEQFGGVGQTDARTDIYCLGATLHHLLTGYDPCEPPYEVFPIRKYDRTLSPGMEKIVEKCMKQNPDERYQSGAEVLYDLLHYNELDYVYRRRMAARLGTFAFSAILCIFFLLSGLLFRVRAAKAENNGYSDAMEQAYFSTESDERISLYKEAVYINPKKSEAYIDLINYGYLSDDVFSLNEEMDFRELLLQKKDGTYLEDILKSNAEEYDAVAYRVGVAYYYYYEDHGNKALASKWFHIASASDTLPQDQIERASRLEKISNYYAGLGKTDKSGDTKVSYKQYWSDLKSISEGNIAQIDNPTTALVIYREVANQININSAAFRKDGITYEEMDMLIGDIHRHIETDFDEKAEDYSSRIAESIELLCTELDMARSALANAFQTENKP